ncbi:MAG: helix-turn-helix transcriptional regulator [Comamonas sp.]|nr:helix-turn-helix transcriptional regulator [Comamonas sp.]
MSKIKDLHQQWLQEPDYQAAYAATQAEFELARQLIQTRIQSGLSQQELANRMGTSQSAIARLESGRTMPSMRTLAKFAEATNSRLQVLFQPA